MNKVQKLFQKDIKKRQIKPLPDKELHQLLVKAIKSEDEKERKEARKKIIEHILPIIISKCKKYFPEDYLIENTDFINEVIMLIMERLFKNFRIDEQEEGRCALFFKAMQFYFLCAYNSLKKKYFGTSDVKYKEFFNWKAKISDKDYDIYKIRMIENYFNSSKKEVLDIDNWEYWAMELSEDIGSDSNFEVDKIGDSVSEDMLSTMQYVPDYDEEIEKKEKFDFLVKKVLHKYSILENIFLHIENVLFCGFYIEKSKVVKKLNISKDMYSKLRRQFLDNLTKEIRYVWN